MIYCQSWCTLLGCASGKWVNKPTFPLLLHVRLGSTKVNPLRLLELQFYTLDIEHKLRPFVNMYKLGQTDRTSFGWERTTCMIFPGGYIGACSARNMGDPPLSQYCLICLSRCLVPRSFTSVSADTPDCTASGCFLWHSISVIMVFH